MEMKQTDSTIKSRAAVAFAPNQPLQIVEIDVEMPRKDEVLIRNTHTGVCHTDAFTLSGSDPEGVFLWCLDTKVRVWSLLWARVCQA